MLNYIKLLIVFAGLIGFSNATLAHSKVNTTSPENEAILSKVPTSIDLNFGGKIRLTKVTLQLENQDPVDLDLSSYKGFQTNFSLPNTSESRGTYTIEWRGIGTDGHIMQGTFMFTVE